MRTLESIKSVKQSKQFLALAEAHNNLMGYRKQGTTTAHSQNTTTPLTTTPPPALQLSLSTVIYS